MPGTPLLVTVKVPLPWEKATGTVVQPGPPVRRRSARPARVAWREGGLIAGGGFDAGELGPAGDAGDAVVGDGEGAVALGEGDGHRGPAGAAGEEEVGSAGAGGVAGGGVDRGGRL